MVLDQVDYHHHTQTESGPTQTGVEADETCTCSRDNLLPIPPHEPEVNKINVKSNDFRNFIVKLIRFLHDLS